MSRRKQSRFGAISTISTAPVAIGNSVRGSAPITMPVKDGVRAVGRDFAFSMLGTVAAANDWTCVGGFPVTPSVLQTSILRSYAQMYAKFKVNKINAHYITSSPTTQAGDILFYYERDRNGPMVDSTSNGFLPYVLSDPHTIIGPQWTNHTLVVEPSDDWNTTNYGMTTDLNEDSCGSIFLFSKTASASSPGYVLIDYDITFTELSINPRAGILPISRGKWSATTLHGSGAVTAAVSPFEVGILGTNINGTDAAAPVGLLTGDIYKVFFDVTNSTISGTNPSWNISGGTLNNTNVLQIPVNSANSVPITIDDGFTCYAAFLTTSICRLYATYANAQAGALPLVWGATGNVVAFDVCVWMSYVGSNNANLESSY